jgi:hypothetical protein
MGFTAREVDQMSMWEFRAAVDGWNRANGNAEDSSGGPLSEREKDEIWEWMQEQPAVPVNRMH